MERSRRGSFLDRLEAGDAILFLYVTTIFRQYLCWTPFPNVVAWILAAILAGIVLWFYVVTRNEARGLSGIAGRRRSRNAGRSNHERSPTRPDRDSRLLLVGRTSAPRLQIHRHNGMERASDILQIPGRVEARGALSFSRSAISRQLQSKDGSRPLRRSGSLDREQHQNGEPGNSAESQGARDRSAQL
jgi:hypothetical protein